MVHEGRLSPPRGPSWLHGPSYTHGNAAFYQYMYTVAYISILLVHATYGIRLTHTPNILFPGPRGLWGSTFCTQLFFLQACGNVWLLYDPNEQYSFIRACLYPIPPPFIEQYVICRKQKKRHFKYKWYSNLKMNDVK